MKKLTGLKLTALSVAMVGLIQLPILAAGYDDAVLYNGGAWVAQTTTDINGVITLADQVNGTNATANFGSTQVGLMGDVNGDGYDDTVLYNAGAWITQTTTDIGGVITLADQVNGTNVTANFGSTQTGLMGDINGDGYDDTVLYSGGAWIAQTTTDIGGVITLADQVNGTNATTNFGSIHTPLMGDINGDGYDDTVLYNAGAWIAQTTTDIGGVITLADQVNGTNFTANFGSTHTPLLGDINADGYDDLVLYSGGTWISYTTTNIGGVITMADQTNGTFYTANFGSTQTPLLGNINGAPIPEPASVVMFGLGAFVALTRRSKTA